VSRFNALGRRYLGQLEQDLRDVVLDLFGRLATLFGQQVVDFALGDWIFDSTSWSRSRTIAISFRISSRKVAKSAPSCSTWTRNSWTVM